MKTIQELLHEAAQFLSDQGIRQPRLQAEEALAHALHMKRLDLYMQFDRPLNANELATCSGLLRRRAKGEPLSYIRGNVQFLDCHLTVNPHVLIPRQETELLASRVIQDLAGINLHGKVLWDLCCGSGCLGIAIKKRYPEIDVVLSDVSPEALAVAKENADRNGAAVRFLLGDLFEPFGSSTADFVVCNPPYVSEAEFVSLDKEVKDFEPRLALVAEDDGLAFYRRLAVALLRYLHPGGRAWLEIGYRQGNDVKGFFPCPPWRKARLEKDFSGRDRFFFLEIE